MCLKIMLPSYGGKCIFSGIINKHILQMTASTCCAKSGTHMAPGKIPKHLHPRANCSECLLKCLFCLSPLHPKLLIRKVLEIHPEEKKGMKDLLES